MKYFITGITGTLGQAVTQLLLQDPESQVIGYSRDECKQASMPKHERLTLYLGDIRDSERLVEACRDVDVIFHFAALKHVDILEDNPEESIATNIKGTQNVLHAQRINKIKRVVLSSTDKACYPVNVYGSSKYIAERLVLRNPSNIVCRYGNVIASRGSAIPKFVRTLIEQNAVYLTDPNMTRFWITIDEAARFVTSMRTQTQGGLYIPPMKAASLRLIVESLSRILGIDSYETRYQGMRAGEKIHECLRTDYEGDAIHSNTAPQFTLEAIRDLLKPIVGNVV